MTPAAKRNKGFDLARSLSMVYIIGMLHLSAYTELAIERYPLMVSLVWTTLGVFTFLSGFLLGGKYTFTTFSDVKTFYRKRLVRFYPLFLISSLLLLAIHFNSLGETLKGLTGLSPFWMPQQHTLWYIATLMSLYLVTPLISSKVMRGIGGGIAFCSLLGLSVLLNLFTHSVDPRFYYYFIVYYCGILAAGSFKQQTLTVLGSLGSLWLLPLWALGLALIAVTGSRLVMLATGYLGIVVVLNVSILISERLKKSAAFDRWVTAISYGSMCAYLFHREIYWVFLEIWRPESEWLTLAYLFFIAFPVVLWISYYIQQGYDNIYRRLSAV